jgi:hypothetical protein
MAETITPESLVRKVEHVDVKAGEFLVVHLDDRQGPQNMRMFIHAFRNFAAKNKVTAPVMFVSGNIRISTAPKQEVLQLESKTV